MTSDEYRIAHKLSMGDPLQGRDTTEKRRNAAYEWMKSDPEHLERMWSRRPGGAVIRDEVRANMGERRAREEADLWARRLAVQGWVSWQDAADWAIDQNLTWVEVAALWGMSEAPVRRRAQTAGVDKLDRRLTPHQYELLQLAEARMAEKGTLWRAAPAQLSGWLSTQRKLLKKGIRRRVHRELDRIDPEWSLDPGDRVNAPCSVDSCAEPWEIDGLCKNHYQRRRGKRKRDAKLTPDEQVECLECGERFRMLGTHLWRLHGLRVDEYRHRHGFEEDVVLAADDVCEQRREHGLSEEAQERVKAMQRARWGGTPDERWAAAFEREGWSSWDEVVAWAMAENKGFGEISQRLGFAESKVRARAKEFGVELQPPMTPTQVEYLEMARVQVAEVGDLRWPKPPELGRWLHSRRDALKAGSFGRVDAALDELDPDWRLPASQRPALVCEEDGCTAEGGAESRLCRKHTSIAYRKRRKAEAAKALGLVEDTTMHLGHMKQKAQAVQRWEARFTAQGWSGWGDAVEWALEHNLGWPEVAERLGVDKAYVITTARKAGFRLPLPLPERAWEMIGLAADHVAAHGDLSGPLAPNLASWLVQRRASLEKGQRGRSLMLLDRLDLNWKDRKGVRTPSQRQSPSA